SILPIAMEKNIVVKLYILLALISIPLFSNAKGEDKTELLKKAKYEESVGNYWAAVKLYTKLLELEPNSADLYFRRGISKIELRDAKGAVEDFTKSIELKPGNVDAYKERAQAYYDLNDFPHALADNDKAIELDP